MTTASPAATAHPSKDRFPGIQAMRGVAAMMIVLCHAAAQPNRMADDASTYDIPMTLGAAGVDIFFAISGFVIFYGAFDAAGARLSSPAHFLLRRLVRIYPMYWLIVAAMILATGAGFFASVLVSARTVAAAVTLFPSYDTILPISWTLTLEMVFYLWFTLALLRGPRRFTLLAVTSLIVASMALAHLLPPSYLRDLLTSDIQLEFVGGMVLAYILSVRPGRRLAPAWLMIPAALYLVASLWFAPRDPGLAPHLRGLFWGPAALALVAAATAIKSFTGPARLFELLGAASYSIYLTHVFVTGAYHALLERGLVTGGVAWIAAFCAIAAVVGIAAHLIAERPLLRLGRRLADRIP